MAWGRPAIEDRGMTSSHRPAALAMVLAGASALVSLSWLAGATWGLDSLGGGLEQLARERSSTALVLLGVVTIAKVAAVALAWAMTRPRVARPLVHLASWGGGALAAYGVLLTAGSWVGLALDLDGADRTALGWHAALWDPWFAIWGVALLLAGRAVTRDGAISPRRARTPSAR